MEQRLARGGSAVVVPTFYLTGRQPLRPAAVLLAIAGAVGALVLVLYALRQTGHAGMHAQGSGTSRADSASSGGKPPDDDKDDPNQVDTIVLGDPGDAPVPAKRGDHVSPVHATIVVRLPRFGDEVGLIPDTPAGRLLYGWLAAFNQGNAEALGRAVPTLAPEGVAATELALRRETGGFSLLSAKEVEPGVLVFRLRDQTPAAAEVLGTLQVRAGSNPAAVGSFSLRAVR